MILGKWNGNPSLWSATKALFSREVPDDEAVQWFLRALF